MPNDFDHTSYDSVNLRLAKYSQSSSAVWGHFAAAWNGIAYRFRALNDYDKDFTKRASETGIGSSAENLYMEEKYLFGFFASGLSTLECLSYAVYAIGALIDSSIFVFTADNLESITLKNTTKKYTSRFSAEGISIELQNLINSAEYGEWKKVRNILLHREVPSRVIFLEAAPRKFPEKPDVWKSMPGFDISDSTTSRRRIWLSEQVNLLLREIDTFTQNQFGD